MFLRVAVISVCCRQEFTQHGGDALPSEALIDEVPSEVHGDLINHRDLIDNFLVEYARPHAD